MSTESIFFTKTTRENTPPRLDVTMSIEQFNVLQQDSCSYDELTLTQLAEHDPAAAYERFNRIIRHIITISQDKESFSHRLYDQELANGEVISVVEKQQSLIIPEENTFEEIDAAREYMQNFLPATPDGSFDLSVAVRLSDDEALLFGTKNMSMLDFSFRTTSTTEPV